MVTDSLTARYLLRGQLTFLARQGFEVTVICSPGAHLDAVRSHENVECHELSMEREIRPLRDLRSLFRLFRLLRRLRPDVVSASTPKAGLLGTIAGALSGVPRRLYTVRGLRLETVTGWKQTVLRWTERAASRCAHRVVCVSPSLRSEYLERGLAPAEKTLVLGPGSSNGVDVTRFFPARDGDAPSARGSLGLETDVPVVGFVGRLVHDKGIDDLARAFEEVVLRSFPKARLLVLGDFEPGDKVSATTRHSLADREEMILPGFVEDTAPWYRAMDVLAFPSYREGFPNAPMEAAATGIPTVGYEATGTKDAVVDGTTGTIVPKGDWRALGAALCRYLADETLHERHGAAALERARRQFSNEVVWQRWADFYESPWPETQRSRGFYPRFGKRLLDLTLALAAGIALLPILITVGLAVLIVDGRPVLFRQQRPGQGERVFSLIKFRTMKPGGASDDASDTDRLTRLGKFLRRTSLDELPSLWNVVRGEMSLVGPRPLLVKYLPRYSSEQRRRHRVRPGLTGWAQVRGRNALSWTQKFEHDLWYVANYSLSLDVKILAMTLGQVVRGRGISAPEHATMPEFQGNEDE